MSKFYDLLLIQASNASRKLPAIVDREYLEQIIMDSERQLREVGVLDDSAERNVFFGGTEIMAYLLAFCDCISISLSVQPSPSTPYTLQQDPTMAPVSKMTCMWVGCGELEK